MSIKIASIMAGGLPALLAGCQSPLPGRPPGQGLFPPVPRPGPPPPGAGTLWVFLAAVLAGGLLYWLLRRRRQDPGRGAVPEMVRLRAALEALEEVVAGCRRSGVVVSMAQWLRRKRR